MKVLSLHPSHFPFLSSLSFLFLFFHHHIISDEIGETFYEQPMFLNNSAISITSITYNPNSHYSEWISRLFGDEAVFYNHSSASVKSPKPLTAKERLERTQLFHSHFQIPPEMLLPTCSIEMLGYASVIEESPLSFRQSVTSPSIGYADLAFYKNRDNGENNEEEGDAEAEAKTETETETEDPGETHRRRQSSSPKQIEVTRWRCLYRAMYDNTGVLLNLKLRPHHYWPVFFYCPAPNHDDSCLQLINLYRYQYKQILLNELKLKNLHLKDKFPNMKFPTEATERQANHKDEMNRKKEFRQKRLREQKKKNGNLPETGGGIPEQRQLITNKNGENTEVELYKKMVRNIYTITNLDILGLRSFYAIPSYTVSRKFMIKSFTNVLGIKEFEYAKVPTLKQSSLDRVFMKYCPAKEERTINPKKRTLPTVLLSANLFFHLNQTTWELPLEIDLLNSVRKTRSEELGVCSLIPYISSDDTKAVINGAMIYEYLRYYLKLGYKIMLFDRNGRHYKAIFRSPYAKRFSQYNDDIILPSIHYYNYTLLQILKGYPIDVRYENDIGLSPAVIYTDYDKRYTYTHCRFAMKHLYGIENVVINDFDEFLYCPEGNGNALQQRQFQQSYFQHLKQKGYEQLFMKQRVLVSREDNMKDCMMKQVLIGSSPHHPNYHNASIFHCLSKFKYSVKSYFDKTLHFGHYCPYTHYHYSSYLRYFDCYTNTYLTATKRRRNYDIGGCSMVHLTTRPATYNRSHPFKNEEIQSGINELYSIAVD